MEASIRTIRLGRQLPQAGAGFPAILAGCGVALRRSHRKGARRSMASDEKKIRRTLHFKFTVPGASEQIIAMIKSAAPLYQMFGDAQVRLLQNVDDPRSEEHTSELQSHVNLVCRLLLE